MYNIYELDELYLKDIVEEEVIVSSSINSNINYEKYVKVSNQSNFIVNFNIISILNDENYYFTSGEFYNGFTKQISLSNKFYSIYLIIESLDESMQPTTIYKKDIDNFTNISFKVSGTLENPIVSEEF